LPLLAGDVLSQAGSHLLINGSPYGRHETTMNQRKPNQRKLPTRWVGIILAGALVFVLPSCASADTLTQFAGIGFSGVSGPLFLQPFDHKLGTLTSVDITVDGQISALVATNPNFVPTGNGGSVPVPLPFSVALDQNFFGISSHSFFSFFEPATFQLNGTASGLGEVQQLASSFVYTFHFDSNSDFLGQAPISAPDPLIPPIFALGTLAGFTDTFSPLMEEFIVTQPSAVFPSAVNGSLASWSDDGGIIVQYNYTPAPLPAPEPSSLLLLGTGLLTMAAAWRLRSPRV
jgi:hypothetical protein